MNVKLWGVRGSLPSPMTPDQIRDRFVALLKDFEMFSKANPRLTAESFMQSFPRQYTGGYGGNTSCGEVTFGSSRLIIDAGSGIRNLSDYLLGLQPQPNEFHIYFTHFHWDHLIGLPFFEPIYMKGKTIHIYGVHDDLEECIRAMFKKPQFPVPFADVKDQVKFHKLEPRKPHQIGEMTITPYELDHPDPCWGVRVEAGGKSLAWAVDNECTRASRDQLGKDAELYKNADLMVFDAQYTFDQALEKMSWGHASGPIGIDLALREGIKEVMFIHHDPGATDTMVRVAEQETLMYFEEIMRTRQKAGLETANLRWHFASEGEVLNLKSDSVSLKSQVENRGADVLITFAGVIDEAFQFPVFPEVEGRLYLDLEKLTMINSFGCRRWIQWFKDVVRAKGGVSLVKCSPAIVHQINILSGFLPKGVQVESFFVPYQCAECGHEEQKLLVNGIDFTDGQLLNEVSDRLCGACGALMSPDIIPNRYFQFLTKKAG